MSRAQLLGGVGLLLPRHGLGEADTSRLVMICDHPGCRQVPDRAPRILVPSCTPHEPEHRPIKIMTDLHFCLPHHRDAFRPEQWFTGRTKAQIEAAAKLRRPADFRPDFEAATVEWLLVTTPEYRAFLAKKGIARAFTA